MKQEDMLLSLNDYNTPKVVTDTELMNIKILRLLLLEPGTYPDQPDRGFGIQSRYRYMLFDEASLIEFKTELKRCIDQWFPTGNNVEIYVSLEKKIMNIGIVINDVFYEYIYDGENLKESTLTSMLEEGDRSGSIVKA